MKTRALLILLAITLILIFASDARSASVGVYFDAGGSQSTTTLVPFVEFPVYLIARGIGSIEGIQLRMDTTDLEANGIVVVSRTVSYDPCSGGGVCIPTDDPDNFIRALTQCVDTMGSDYTILSYSLMYAQAGSPSDVTFCVRPSEPAQFSQPAYMDCDANLWPLEYEQRDTCGIYGDGCAVINPSGPGNCVIENEVTGLGTIKARW